MSAPTLPDLLSPLTYEEILKAAIERTKELLPGYIPAPGDDVMLILQSFAYREMLLRQYLQSMVEGNYLYTATGASLDHLAITYYGLERQHGSRPWTEATFSLTTALDYDVTIPVGYELTEDGGIYHAYTLEELTIPQGQTEITGRIELGHNLSHAKVRTEIPVSPIPFLEVHQLGDFDHGGDEESDEEFRERIRISLSDKSTAGAERTYLSFTFAADERISDVVAYSPGDGEVRVVYWAPQMDSVMQDRVTAALNDKDVRPLTDHVTVTPAIGMSISVNATLTLSRGADAAAVTAAARDAIAALAEKPQIGRDVHPAPIIRALMVDGVENVQLSNPTDTVLIDSDHIALLSAGAISTQESSDVY